MRNVVQVLLVLAAALAAACGAPDKKADCGGPGQCPRGQYCAAEGVCWPDAAPPTVTGFSATCAGPCVRDGVVRVVVTATDESRMGTVRARLDLDPAIAVTLPRSGAGWAGDVALAGYPFPAFERPVSVTVEVADEAGNAAAGPLPAVVQVSRLKWVFEGVGTDGSVAVYPDGSVLAASSATDQVVRIGRDGAKVWGANPAPGAIAVFGVPSIGAGVAWVGNSAGAVFAVSDAGVVVNGAGCATGGAVLGPPAVNSTGEVAFATSLAGPSFAVSAPSTCRDAAGPARTSSPAVVGTGGAVYSAAFLNQTSTAVLRSLSYSSTFSDNWLGLTSPQVSFGVGSDVEVPLAIDSDGSVLTLSTDGKLTRTQPSAASANVADTSCGESGPVVLADHSIVVGDAGNLVQRFSSAGVPLWTPAPNLGAPAQTPLVLTGGDAQFIVPTSSGKLFALRADGTEAWSGQLVPGSGALRPGNIHTPAGSSLSLGYFPAANGRLYAVVLDGRLDAAAPWPKAFHDPRNTGNAATPIP